MIVEPLSADQQAVPLAPSPGRPAPDAQNLSEVFLQLLVTELSYQDPLNPVNGAEFVAQLAQLSVLGQMQELNNGLRAILTMQQLTQATSLIGRQVQATGPDGMTIEGEVTGVRVTDGEITLVIDETTVPLDSVVAISAQPTENLAGEAENTLEEPAEQRVF